MPVAITTANGVPVPYLHNYDEAFLRWQTHLDAGRIGNPPPCPPAIAANRTATDILFREITRDRRILARELQA